MTFPTRSPLQSSPVAATPALDEVALHLLRAIVRAAKAERGTHLEELASAIGVRKADCRRALSTLHRQGYVDVLRMRPTFEGFALGSALQGAAMRALRAAAAEPAPPVAPPTELVRRDVGRVGPRTSEPPPSSRAA